jgi:dynein light chain LC8-type
LLTIDALAGAISHETRQYIHIKVDTYHIIIWKSKDSPFHMTDN